MKRFDKHTVQTLGVALIVIGYLLFIISPFGGPYQSCPPVPSAYPGGCPLPPGTLFISAIGLIVAGIVLFVFTRRIKAKPKTD